MEVATALLLAENPVVADVDNVVLAEGLPGTVAPPFVEAERNLVRLSREGLLTALETAFTRLDQPMELGYSSAGTIVAAGPGLQGFRVGDRVACAGGGGRGSWASSTR